MNRDAVWKDFADESVRERFSLISERIREIGMEQSVPENYRDYFAQTAEFLQTVVSVFEQEEAGTLSGRSLRECQECQEKLYGHILPQNYGTSCANPAYAAEQFGGEAGRLLAFLRSELDAVIGYAFEGRLFELTVFLELFVEVYNCMEQGDVREAKCAVYWFFHDYSEIFVEDQIREMIDPEGNFFVDIIKHADLSNPRYLYRYGLPVGENEIGAAEFLNRMSDEEIKKMADTFTEGYRIGFAVTGKDLTKKKTAQLHYCIGFERMMREAIRNFEKMGLRVTVSREAAFSFFGKGAGKRGAYSTSLNRQYEFDHREDRALYFDKKFVERRLEVLRTVFEQHKAQAAKHAGPAVLEVFGEEPFSPENKKEAIRYSEKQQQLAVYNASVSGQITNEFIKGEERSFTIIAYPIPAIGVNFEEIFAQTAVINTLDYKKYQKIQQALIDVLDTAEKVRITGKGDNRTDLTVSVCPLADPQKQTAFENCVADVNIPVGEVFTSPVLAGTNGVLHVSEVFLNGLQYRELELHFTDGMVTSYTCENFADEKENKKYIRDNVLMRHDALPMGEFAIGTNTTAYRMAKKFGIADKLPILIAEKTGPHFAVGDTCYSHAEDTAVYNPDGKEIVARDNEVSLLRREEPSKAYFNCHTDITIPYDELDAITAIRADGSSEDIIRDGLFVVPGTEELNAPLNQERRQTMAKVGIVMGSDSDMPVMAKAAEILDKLGISYEMRIISAHREPDVFFEYAKGAEERGLKVIIAGAGKAAHLPGMCAAIFPMPVIGIPMKTSDLGGVDSLYSIVQMPSGIPVATVAINGGANAGILAAKILATSDPELLAKLKDYAQELKEQVEAKDAKLQEVGYKNY